MKVLLAQASLLATSILLSTPARADVAPPEALPCQGKAAGDACVYDKAGTCQNQTCSKADYAHWDRDASWGPPSMTYACLKCVVGTATVTSTATSTQTAANTNADGGTPPSNDDSACSVGKQVTAKRVAPWLMAGAFSLLFVFARRRRQS